MDRNRNEYSHRGYSNSDFSPSTGDLGGAGRFSGNNYGGTGSGSYYGAGYETTPYGGGNTNAVSGMGRGSYSGGNSGALGGGHMENTYGSSDRSASYGGGRIEEGYGRGERYDDERYRNYNRGGEYGTTGGGYYGSASDEYERDRRSSFGGHNYEGSRRGTSGNFSGPGRGGNENEGRGYGLSDVGWNPSSFVGPDSYGERGRHHRPEDVHDVTDYGFRNRRRRGGSSFTGMDMNENEYSGGSYGSTGSYGGGMSRYGGGNYQGSDRSAGQGHAGSNFYNSGRIDWDYNRGSYGPTGTSGSYMGGSGSHARERYDDIHGGSGRSNDSDWSYSHGATYGGGMNENYRSSGEGGGYYGREGRSTHESGYGGGSYGTGRSSHATGGNTSRDDMPGGAYSDPWL